MVLTVELALAALLTLLPRQQPPDTAAALRQAKDLVLEHYDYLALTGRFNPHPVGESGRACTGASLQDCMDGDWSCLDIGCDWGHAERRVALIPKLEALAPQAGDSEWLFRQRVGFAIKNEELERADGLAHTCPDRAWWCQALRGLTAHLLRPGDGLTHFDSAFALVAENPRRLPSGQFAWGEGLEARCQWSDVRAVVPVEMLDEVQGWRCPEEEEVNRTFWWLADPLWSQEGNERYAEHLARQVMIRMDMDVQELLHAEAKGGRYDRRLWESRATYDHVLREGFPNSNTDPCWDPDPFDPRGVYGCPGSRIEYVHGGYSFAPGEDRFRRPMESTAEDWALEWHNGGCQPPWKLSGCGRQRMPSRRFPSDTLEAHDGCRPPWRLEDCGAERMITRERWHNLEHQTVVLRRGRGLLFVSAAQVPEELGPTEELEPSLALGRPADLSSEVVPAVLDDERVFRARSLVDSGEYLASIEVVGADETGRARFGAPAPPLTDGFGVSDLALVHPLFGAGGMSLEEALLPSTDLTAGQHVGLYFEIYGLGPKEAVELSLTAEEVDVSILGRMARALHLGSRGQPSEIVWEEPEMEGGAVTPRFFSFDLGNLGEGEYRLTLEVRGSMGREALASRAVSVR